MKLISSSFFLIAEVARCGDHRRIPDGNAAERGEGRMLRCTPMLLALPRKMVIGGKR